MNSLHIDIIITLISEYLGRRCVYFPDCMRYVSSFILRI